MSLFKLPPTRPLLLQVVCKERVAICGKVIYPTAILISINFVNSFFITIFAMRIVRGSCLMTRICLQFFRIFLVSIT